jgi:hypothetical protein
MERLMLEQLIQVVVLEEQELPIVLIMVQLVVLV